MNIYIDPEKSPPNSKWIHARDFDDFKNLLDTVALSKIGIVSFKYSLSDNILESTGEDCAHLLITRARGERLPQCIVHCNEGKGITEIIDHYNQSYGYEDRCVRVQQQKVGSL